MMLTHGDMSVTVSQRTCEQDRFAGCRTQQIDLAARQAARKIYKGKPFLCGKSSETPRNHILAI